MELIELCDYGNLFVNKVPGLSFYLVVDVKENDT
jgi:hypothetical protein